MENIVIIGSGPAGLTAAIYCARAGLAPLLVSGLQVGGQLTTTTMVENFPGFPKGIDGNELMSNMQAQAQEFGAKIETANVEKISQNPDASFLLHTDAKSIAAKAIIVATGASALTLDLPQKNKLMGYGLSTCAICDGFFYRNKVVAVVGGGDSAMEEATYLAKLAKQVYLIVRRDKLRASKAMQDRAKINSKITFIYNSQVIDTLQNEKGLTGIVVENNSGERSTITVDGLFMAIGHKPNTDFLKNVIELDNKGYIVTYKGTRTSMAGIFAAGDVEDTIYKQAVTAAARGCQAALEAERYLNEIE